ncbi:hypothetical protein LY90DRAFT_252913 [Neocallimastix californiae]|uniref:Ima1 N-terminal domain-containing protein n=1 Tax=Neocallimastix californiae TaxID=1754190 RepID=A0A1Y2DEA2_9FUNG|nr:hypothetical protein LY90DRAFT_252913 [Neocallimastix californiae]|eukprot:ORY57623.1 hypothetical protein LY90DRAFT_252913 [Neocallimastix californiae]
MLTISTKDDFINQINLQKLYLFIIILYVLIYIVNSLRNLIIKNLNSIFEYIPRLNYRSKTIYCFYCGKKKTFQKYLKDSPNEQNWYNWFCEECNSWNKRDRNGEIIESYPEMYLEKDENKNLHNNRVNDSEQKPVFCSNCLQNQKLIVQLLASYDPGNDELYDLTINEYRKSLESRYPIICSKCAKNANNELKQQNYHIKTKILNFQLQQSVNQFNSYQNLSLIFLLIWLFAMSFIIFFDIFTIIYHTYGIIYPKTFYYNNCSFNGKYISILKKRWEEDELFDKIKYFHCYFKSPFTENRLCQCLPYHVTPILIFIYLFTMFFNPLWLKKKRIGGEIINKNAYLKNQFHFLIIRVLSYYTLKTNQWSIKESFSLHLLFLILCSYLIIKTFSILKFIPYTKITNKNWIKRKEKMMIISA